MKEEPVAFASVLRLFLLALMAFGFKLSPAQLAAVMLFVEAVLGFLTRKIVTPVRD